MLICPICFIFSFVCKLVSVAKLQSSSVPDERKQSVAQYCAWSRCKQDFRKFSKLSGSVIISTLVDRDPRNWWQRDASTHGSGNCKGACTSGHKNTCNSGADDHVMQIGILTNESYSVHLLRARYSAALSSSAMGIYYWGMFLTTFRTFLKVWNTCHISGQVTYSDITIAITYIGLQRWSLVFSYDVN